jgi:hypothetical protein
LGGVEATSTTLLSKSLSEAEVASEATLEAWDLSPPGLGVVVGSTFIITALVVVGLLFLATCTGIASVTSIACTTGSALSGLKSSLKLDGIGSNEA